MIALMPFVREHRVCWEIAPHFEAGAGQLKHVGFDLTLHAQPPPGVDPGSEQAAAIHERLREIALQVLPNGVAFTVEPFEASLHFRRETGWGAEVDLIVALCRGEGTFQVVDAAERCSVRSIGGALGRLGIPEGVYRKAA